MCGTAAQLLIQAIQATGGFARRVELRFTPKDAHAVVEVWSEAYQKWVVLDPDYDLYYTVDGVPQNALELHDYFSRDFDLIDRVEVHVRETPEQRITDIANTAERYLKIEGFAREFEDYMSRGYYSLATPVWINFGKEKGLPISCYGSYIDDTMDSILNTVREIGMMSKYGGGTSAYLGNIRARGSRISTGGSADGPVHYARLYDTTIDVSKQSEARRGACAVYLPIEHNDILEFLDIGTEGNPIQNSKVS